jgi:hypothetical protein
MAFDPDRNDEYGAWRRIGGVHRRSNPLDDPIGVGRKHPILGLFALWIAGIGVIAGVSIVAPRQLTAVVAIGIILWLLGTVRI